MSFIAIAVGALAIGWARRKLLASEAPSGGTSHGVVAPTGSGRQIADHSAVRAGEGYGGIERAGIDNIQRKLILAMYLDLAKQILQGESARMGGILMFRPGGALEWLCTVAVIAIVASRIGTEWKPAIPPLQFIGSLPGTVYSLQS